MDRVDHPEGEVTIGVVGKYVGLPGRLQEPARGAGPRRHRQPGQGQHPLARRRIVRAATAPTSPPSSSRCTAILVPGGFGERGSEGKIAAVRFARERKVPFFGICLGMQMACIEGARNTAGIADASTTEFGETAEPVVGLITEWMSEEGLQKRAADDRPRRHDAARRL